MEDFDLIRCMAVAFSGNPKDYKMSEFDGFLNQTNLVELRFMGTGLRGLVNF